MNWHFPLINPKTQFSMDHFSGYVSKEVKEFEEEADPLKKAIECLDVLHCAETLTRKFFADHPEFDVDDLKRRVIEKNTVRGYYSD